MAWVVLVVSGMFEAVWAVALGKSDGLTRAVPAAVFLAALVVSMGGLAVAMRSLPTATSYVVWVGIGATLTVTFSLVTGEERLSVARVLLLGGVLACVGGLKALP